MDVVVEPGSDSVIAFTESKTAEVAGMSVRTLRRWAEQGLVGPSIWRRISPRNTVRLYTFQDVLAATVLADLGKRHRHPRLAKELLVWLLFHERFASPLTELRFATDASDVYVELPNGGWHGGKQPRQGVMPEVLELTPIRQRIRRAAEARRSPEEYGKIVRTRRVHGSRACFAGTRIPVDRVLSYLAAGESETRILSAFPRLVIQDIEAARAVRAEAS